MSPDVPSPDPVDRSIPLDELGYAEAVSELEEILAQLDGDDVDVDRLAAQVRRAADLITLCRDRLTAARLEVTRIVADLDVLDAAASDAAFPESSTGSADSEDVA